MKTIEISDEVYEKLKDKILEEEKLVKEKKEIKIEIKNRFTGDIIFSSTKTTIREAVEEAISESANLKYANTKYCIVNFSKNEYAQAKQFIEGLK